MNINSIRTVRRMAVAASGMVAAVSLVIGAGAASAGPVLSAKDSPTIVFSCGGSPQSCYVHDADGIKEVARHISGTVVTVYTAYNGLKDGVVFSERTYDLFTVTDMRGIKRTYSWYDV